MIPRRLLLDYDFESLVLRCFMRDLKRQQFVTYFGEVGIERGQVPKTGDLPASLDTRLREADLNQDGNISGTQEAGRLFDSLDQIDRNGRSNSIAIVSPGGKKTRLGKTVDALARHPAKISGETPCAWRLDLKQAALGRAIIKLGDKGRPVRALQEGLSQQGYSVDVDGKFGPLTQRALLLFQRDQALAEDGVAGSATAGRLLRQPSTNQDGEQRLSPYRLSLETFPVGGERFNIGYDPHWNAFDSETAHHNSDYSLHATDPNHRGGHLGIDIFGPKGAAIVAPVSGKVVSAGYSAKGGYHVTIRRGEVHYYHAHLTHLESTIKEGSDIVAGTVLGGLGDTGSARGTEPHLHFSMYESSMGYRNGTINPYPSLKGSLHSDDG
jgi:murein DD-endopeptidase MepM/ murein hydrolase activator NlpD